MGARFSWPAPFIMSTRRSNLKHSSIKLPNFWNSAHVAMASLSISATDLLMTWSANGTRMRLKAPFNQMLKFFRRFSRLVKCFLDATIYGRTNITACSTQWVLCRNTAFKMSRSRAWFCADGEPIRICRGLGRGRGLGGGWGHVLKKVDNEQISKVISMAN